MKKIDIDKLEVSSKLDDVINSAVSEGYKNINAKAKKKSTNNKIKKSIIAASIAIGVITTGVVTTPAIAANIPIIGDIYRQLGFFKGFEDYTNYIGETKEVDGYKFTIDNIVGTPTDLLVGVKVESPIPFEKNNNEKWVEIDVNMNDFGIKGMSGNVSPYYLDDNTVIVTSNLKNVEGKFKKFGDINIKTSYRDITDENNKPINAEFNIKVDFTSSFNKIEAVKVDKKVNDILNIKSIVSSVIGTDIIFKTNIEGESIESFDVWGSGRDIYYLEVDGSIHLNNSTSGINDISMMNFPTVKYDDIKNAKSINVVYITPTMKERDLEDIEYSNDIEMVTENNITYPKTIITEVGLKGEFYKLEGNENTLKAYFKSEYNPLPMLQWCRLNELDDSREIIRIHLPKSYKNENGDYVLEFNNVNLNNKLDLPKFSVMIPDEDYEYKTVKIK